MAAENPDSRAKLKFPRYCSRSFPPYRFTPGLHPHPTANPEGHSYHPPDQHPAPPPYVSPENWQQNEEYLFGCDLYNHGYWWEAHEAWEGFWRILKRGDMDRSLIHGLIQVSACHLQLHLGRMGGVQRLRRTSEEHLNHVIRARSDGRFMGLNVPGFLSEVETYYAPRLTSDAGPPVHDPAIFPYIRLAI